LRNINAKQNLTIIIALALVMTNSTPYHHHNPNHILVLYLYSAFRILPKPLGGLGNPCVDYVTTY